MAKFTANLAGIFDRALPTFASGMPGTTPSDQEGFAQAQPPVRYDTGPQPGEEQLRQYKPSWRDTMGATIAGDSAPNSARYNFAQGLVGSAGAGKHGVGPLGLSVLDVPSPLTGFGLASPALDMQEAAMRGDTQGFKRAMVGVIPGANVEGKIAREAESGVAKVLADAVRAPYERKLNDFGLYSFGAEQAYNLPQETGMVQQMKAMLERMGVKPAEFQHSGFDTAFPDPRAKVSRDDLVQHFEQNVPQLAETERAVSHAYPYGSSRQWQEAIQAAERRRDWDEVDRLTNAWEETEGLGSGAGSNAPRPKYGSYTLPGGSNYRELTTTYTNGEALRLDRRRREIEALGANATPEQKTEWADIMNRLQPEERDIEGAPRFRGFPEYTSGHWDGEKNILVHQRLKDRAIEAPQHIIDDIGERIASSIWPDGRAGAESLASGAADLAVKRGVITPEEAATYSRHRGWQNDYMHQKGLEQNLLHSEELQSDWGQAANKIGVRDMAAAQELATQHASAFEASNEATQAIYRRMDELKNAHPDLFLGSLEGNAAADAEFTRILNNDSEYQRLVTIETQTANEYTALDDALNAARKGVPNAPYIGNTSGWTQLGQKRALWEAAKGEKDALVWNTGKTQADRYNLANQVSELAYDPESNTLYAYDHDGRQVLNENVTPDKLHEHIGEEPAKKLLGAVENAEAERNAWEPYQNPETRRWEITDPNGETLYNYHGQVEDFDTELDAHQHIDWMLEDERAQQYLSRYPSINGLDLEVGGGGMRGYYDNIFGSELKDLLKRTGINKNPKFGTMNIKTDAEEWPYPVRIASDGDNYWLAGRNPRGNAEGEERLSANFKSYVDADTARESFLSGYNQPVHSLALTPEMREAILKGMPYFAIPGAIGLGAMSQSDQRQQGLAGDAL